jgi:hypothetical protein
VKRPVALTIAALAIAALGIALACGSNPIIVATINADAGSTPCELSDAGDASACPDGSFCSTTSCRSNAGTCEPVQSNGCASSEPECGCDRISYFNRCLREEAHASRDVNCEMAMGCFPGSDCPTNSSCATVAPFIEPEVPDGAALTGVEAACRLTKNAPPQVGLCWSLLCPPPGSQMVWDPCAKRCIDECTAIGSGGIYFRCPSDASAD